MTFDKTLIICPFQAEAKLLLSILPNCRQHEKNIWESSIATIKTLNEAGEKPLLNFFSNKQNWENYRKIVLFGAAGGLAPQLLPGQIFRCSKVQHADKSFFLLEKNNSYQICNELYSEECLPCISQITVESPVIERADRLSLYEQTDAQIADMESFFFVKEMQKVKKDFYIIRFISDTESYPFKLPFSENIRASIIKARKDILKILKN